MARTSDSQHRLDSVTTSLVGLVPYLDLAFALPNGRHSPRCRDAVDLSHKLTPLRYLPSPRSHLSLFPSTCSNKVLLHLHTYILSCILGLCVSKFGSLFPLLHLHIPLLSLVSIFEPPSWLASRKL